MNHPERINALAGLNAARSYLEIGVNRGGTFRSVNVRSKVAVDPVFLFDYQKLGTEHVKFHEVTSDYYFSNIVQPEEKFDLIFLDGLHTFEQTYRDFCASLAHAHDKTIWIIDDVAPVSWASSSKEQHQLSARLVRRLTMDKRQHWMGDVFKCVLAIHDFFPQFSYATFSGHGQTVIWKQTRQDFEPTWNSLEKISRLTYWDYVSVKPSHFNVLEESEVLSQAAAGLYGTVESLSSVA